MFGWFGQKRNRKPAPESEVEKIFEKIDNFLRSDAAQNEFVPEQLHSSVIGGINCDEIPGAHGDFGKVPTNPIPVNGPVGEIVYLSRLRTLREKKPILFHRVGSTQTEIGPVDMYEVLSTATGFREYLYLSLYHPRKTVRAPSGYILQIKYDPLNPISGVNFMIPDFPKALDVQIRQLPEPLGMLPLNEVRMYLYGNRHGPFNTK